MKQSLLTTAQAAAYLGGDEKPLKENTLEGWRVKGIGPVFKKINRLVRYSPDDLDAYLVAQTRQSTSQVVKIHRLQRGGGK